MPRYRVAFDDVEGHGYRRGPHQGPQAVTVKAAGGEEYPATLTMDDVEGRRRGHLDFGADDVEGHKFRGWLDQGPPNGDEQGREWRGDEGYLDGRG